MYRIAHKTESLLLRFIPSKRRCIHVAGIARGIFTWSCMASAVDSHETALMGDVIGRGEIKEGWEAETTWKPNGERKVYAHGAFKGNSIK